MQTTWHLFASCVSFASVLLSESIQLQWHKSIKYPLSCLFNYTHFQPLVGLIRNQDHEDHRELTQIFFFFSLILKQINTSLICLLCARALLSGLCNLSGFNAVSSGLQTRGHVGINHRTFCFLATNPCFGLISHLFHQT